MVFRTYYHQMICFKERSLNLGFTKKKNALKNNCKHIFTGNDMHNEQCIRPHLHTSSPCICINKLKITLFMAGIVRFVYVWQQNRCIFSTSDVSNISLIKDLIMQSLYAYTSWRKATGAYRTPRLE